MRKLTALVVMGCLMGLGLAAQTISFGLGDATLETSLNDIGATAKVDMGGFSADVSLQWGIPTAQVTAAVSGGLQPSEVYLAAALSNLSGKPMSTVIATYKANKSKGWGYVAKELGIKPGSKAFQALKDKSAGSASKAKGKKK